MTSLALDYSPPRKAKSVMPPHTKSSSRNCFSNLRHEKTDTPSPILRNHPPILHTTKLSAKIFTTISGPKASVTKASLYNFGITSSQDACNITRPIDTGEKELVQRYRVECQRCELPRPSQLRSPNCTCISREAREYR